MNCYPVCTAERGFVQSAPQPRRRSSAEETAGTSSLGMFSLCRLESL